MGGRRPASLTTKAVTGAYPESQAKIYSALFFYQMLCAVLGMKYFGGFLAALPVASSLWIVGGVLALCALIDFLAPALIFPLARKR